MQGVLRISKWIIESNFSRSFTRSHYSSTAFSNAYRRFLPRFNKFDYGKTKLFREFYLIGLAFGGGLFVKTSLLRIIRCDAIAAQVREKSVQSSPWLISSEIGTVEHNIDLTAQRNRNVLLRFIVYVFGTTIWIIKVTFRIIELTVHFTPLALTYPLSLCSDRMELIWWNFALWTIQKSGPTMIKLGQWASTRRDIFSKQFCDKLASLHTKTTNRKWSKASEAALDALFSGLDWRQFIVSIQLEPVGSGCIAQVYKAKVDLEILHSVTGIQFNTDKEEKQFLDVAIKVAEANMHERIAVDLSILRYFSRFAEMVVPGLSLVNPTSCLEQFETVLKRQVNLCSEARALKRFSQNFDVNKTGIRFPSVLCYSNDVIMETFEEGMYVNRLVTGDHEILANQASSVKRRVALIGARALLKMIFVDNFVHGDLHPGNILIRFNDRNGGAKDVHHAPRSETLFEKLADWFRDTLGLVHEPRIRFTENPQYEDDPVLVILDTGIAIEETPKNLRNLRALFRAIVEKRGHDVGQLLLDHAPQHHCKEPEQFCREIDAVVQIARSKGSLRTLNISELLSQLFSIVSRYHVGLETSFTTVVGAVMVLEGFGRSLDPDLDLFQCARPYLLSVVH
ncbi:unnamed protein product [Anisakis simplex]|uniref:ABC1 domain-containing protein n=1 Tax=Anisakis simplex TaxID=6269 RepID=A0A0M3JZI4_ANISI|nr:unnamed protein product [Anisakis simplex]